MKRLSKYLLVIMLSLFIIPIISVNVNAATLDVKTINASITNNKISVDGTVDNGVLAVAIMIYEEDGTTLTGIWFKPLPDELAHKISKKYQLYRG